MKTLRSLLIAVLLALVCAAPALAQSALNLTVNRDFGYNLGSQIRGTFSMKASGPSDLTSVTFFIDGQPVKQVDAAPFAFQFQTTSYADGFHDLSATGVTAGGQTLTSPMRRFEFVSASQEQSGMGKIVLPILGIVVVLFVVILGFQFLAFRRRKREPVPLGTHRNYGVFGGAICPRCGRPTPIPLGAMNLGFSRLAFCENCGRFGILHPVKLEQLRRAEDAELQDAKSQVTIPEPTAEEKLKQQIDSSRYEDMK